MKKRRDIRDLIFAFISEHWQLQGYYRAAHDKVTVSHAEQVRPITETLHLTLLRPHPGLGWLQLPQSTQEEATVTVPTKLLYKTQMSPSLRPLNSPRAAELRLLETLQGVTSHSGVLSLEPTFKKQNFISQLTSRQNLQPPGRGHNLSKQLLTASPSPEVLACGAGGR